MDLRTFFRPPTVTDYKKEAVDTRSKEKQQRLSVIDQQIKAAAQQAQDVKAFDDAVAQAARTRDARATEIYGDVLQANQRAAAASQLPDTRDLALSFGRTAKGMLSGTVAGGIDALAGIADDLNPINVVRNIQGQEDVPLATAVASPFSQGIMEGSAKVDQFLADKMSTTSRIAEQVYKEDSVASAAVANAERDAALAAGKNEYLVGARRIAQGVSDGAGNLAKNPTHLINTLAGELANTVAIAKVAKLSSTAKAVETLARERAAARTLDFSTPALTEDLIAGARKSLNNRAVAGSNLILEGGGAYQQINDEIQNTEIDVLKLQYPEALAMAEAGYDAEQIKDMLVSKVGVNAAAAAGIAGAVVGRISEKFAADPLNAGQNGLANFGKSTLSELTEESAQGITGTLAVNQARISAGREDIGVTDDMGEAIGQGALTGGLMPSVTALPGAAMATVNMAAAAVPITLIKGAQAIGPVLKATGKAVGTVAGPLVRAAGKAAEGRANAVKAAAEAPAKEARAEGTSHAAARLRENLENMPGALDLDAAMDKLSPEIQASLADTAPADLDQLGVLSTVLNGEDNRTAPATFEESEGLMNYALYADHKLANLVRTTSQQLENPDLAEEDRTALQDTQKFAEQLRQHPVMTNIRGLADKVTIPNGVIEQATALAGAVGGVANLPIELRQATERVRTLVQNGITKNLSPEAIEQTQALYNEDLGEDERFAFGQAIKIANIRKDSSAHVTDRKTITNVGTNMDSIGFELDTGNGVKHLRSMEEFVQEIAGLTQAGSYTAAKEVAGAFSKWAAHQIERSNLFNQEALAQIEDFKQTGQWTKRELPFSQIDASGQKLDINTKQFVDLKFEGGQELGTAVNQDAQSLVDMYNVARDYLPESVRPAALPNVAKHTWQAAFQETGEVALLSAATLAEQAAAGVSQEAPKSQATSDASTSEVSGSAEDAKSVPTAPQAQGEVPKQEDSKRAVTSDETQKEVAGEPETKTPSLTGKTATGNVVIEPVYGQAGVARAKELGGIFSLRFSGTETHFGNPYSSDKRLVERDGLIQTASTAESVAKYTEWVRTSNEPRAQWIREQIRSGKLKNRPILYYKELGEASHANALDYLINTEGALDVESVQEETVVAPALPDVPLVIGNQDNAVDTEPFVPKNEEQREGIQKIQDFLADPTQKYFVLDGKAGTGKTTIMQEALLPYMKRVRKILIAAVSHKAKSVLRGKLSGATKDIDEMRVKAVSLAALLGQKKDNFSEEYTLDPEDLARAPIKSEKVIVIDEASMLDVETVKLILQHKRSDAKVIFLGDIGQLAPIDGDGSISPVFSLVGALTHRLIERVRQGENSSILPYADHYWSNSQENEEVRYPVPKELRQNSNEMEFFQLPTQFLDAYMKYFKEAVKHKLVNRIKIIAYNNLDKDTEGAAQLRALEKEIRTRLFGAYSAVYEIGELVIMNDNYSYEEGDQTVTVENAREFVVDTASEATFQANDGTQTVEFAGHYVTIQSGFEEYTLPVLSKDPKTIQARRLFLKNWKRRIEAMPRGIDKVKERYKYSAENGRFAKLGYAYVITSHKAQGSTYDISAVLEDNFYNGGERDNKNVSRGLYTAITRASKRAVIISHANPEVQTVKVTKKVNLDVSKSQAELVRESEPIPAGPVNVPQVAPNQDPFSDPNTPPWEEAPATVPTTDQQEDDAQTEQEAAAERKAQAAPVIAESMGERFPGLLQEAPAGGENKKLTRNRFLSGFNLRRGSEALFGRFLAPMTAVREALNRGVDGFLEVLSEEGRISLGRPSDENIEGVRAVFNKYVGELGYRMNINLANKVNPLREYLLGPKGLATWNSTDKMQLHVVMESRKADGTMTYHYHPRVVEAMALAGIRWTIDAMNTVHRFDEEAVAKLFPDGVIPSELVDVFRDKQLTTMDVRSIAADLERILGLEKNRDASKTSQDALMKALALDVLVGLSDMQTKDKESLGLNWVKITRVKAEDLYLAEEAALLAVKDHDGVARIQKRRQKISNGLMTFRDFNHEDDQHPMRVLSEQLGNNSELLDVLLDAGQRERAYIGAPPKKLSKTVKGTGQGLGRQQTRMQRVLTKIPFLLNQPLDRMMEGFSESQLLRLFGFQSYDEENGNGQYIKKLKGKEQGARLTITGLNSLKIRGQRYADEQGINREDVPHFWNWRIQSAGRADMQGFSPQANKWARVLYTTTKVDMDLGNQEHLRDFWLTLAQALNIKVEQAQHTASIQEIQNRLADSGKLAPLVEMFRQAADTEGNLGGLGDQIVNEILKQEFSDPSHAFAALETFVRFEKAKGEKTFTHSLGFEIDGKTDGVINALVQFGLGHLNSQTLRQLAQGGLFLGRKDRNTLNENPNQKDTYVSSAEGVGPRINELMQNATAAFKEQIAFGVRALMREGVQQLINDEGSLAAVRKMMKNPTTQRVYGANDVAIMNGMATAIGDNYLRMLHEAIETNELLDERIIHEMQVLLGKAVIKQDRVQKLIPRTVMPLNSIEDYKKFRITVDNHKALVSNLAIGAGLGMALQINEELGATQATTDVIVRATALQAAAANSQYKRLYNARRTELVEAGEIATTDALSINEENKIFEQVQSLLPTYQTSQTKDGGGISVAESDQDGVLPSYSGVSRGMKDGQGKNSVQVTSISGQLSADINVRQIDPSPGVRVVALLNQAAGDGAMMGRLFQTARSMLTVYDGLMVKIGELNSGSQAVNKAVWENWMDDILGGIEKKFEEFQFEWASMTDQELEALIEDLRPDFSIKEFLAGSRVRQIEYIKKTTKDVRESLEVSAREVRAVKQAFSEIDVSVDHMAGPKSPYGVVNGVTLETQEEVLAYLQTRVAEILGYTPATFEEKSEEYAAKQLEFLAPSEVIEEDLSVVNILPKAEKDAPVSAEGTSMSGKQLRATLDKHVFKSRVSGFVYKRIRLLIPDDLKIHAGTAEELRAVQQRLYPDHNAVDTSKKGVYLNGVLFLSSKLENEHYENTLVHELVHATTYGMIKDFYKNNGAGLTWAQKEAVRNLEKLALDAIEMTEDGVPEAALEAFRHFQKILKRYRDDKLPGHMVEELMAYTLTHPLVQQAVKSKKGPLQIRVITKKILNTLRRLFALPDNPSIDSFFIQTLGQTVRLLSRPIADSKTEPSVEALYNELGDGTESVEDSDPRLANLIKSFDQLLMLVPDTTRAILLQANDGSVPYTRFEARMLGTQAVLRMKDATFGFTAQQELVFSEAHAALTAIAALDPLAMDALQQVYAQAMKVLEPKDLQDNPEGIGTDDVDQGIKRYDALRVSEGPDAYGRSPLLTNFVALALVHPGLRTKLDKLVVTGIKVKKTSANDFLRTGAQKLMDLLGDRALHINNRSQQAIFDEMVNRMLHAKKRASDGNYPGYAKVQKLEGIAQRLFHKGYTRLDQRIQRETPPPATAGAARQLGAAVVRGSLHGLRLLAAPEAEGQQLTTVYTSIINQVKMPQLFKDIALELMGTNDENRLVHRLLNESKQRVSQIRQRLREQVPVMIQDYFQERVEKKTMQLLHRTFGQTDLQALLDLQGVGTLAELMRSPERREEAMAGLLAQLPATVALHVTQKAGSLARYMMTKDTVGGDMLMARNAEAIVKRTEIETGRPVPQAAVAIVNQMVSLMALDHLTETERADTAAQIEKDPEGAEKTLRLLGQLVKLELDKHAGTGHTINAWKGYIPAAGDPRKDLLLVDEKKGEELLKRGYHRISGYIADSADSQQGLAYYATKWTGGSATYNQGALQTVENSLAGIDALTGRTLDPATKMMIKFADKVDSIAGRKMSQMKLRGSVLGAGPQLLPIFDGDGKVVAFERPVDPQLLKLNTSTEGFLDQAIGAWMGRQAEETMAADINQQLIEVLKTYWDQDAGTDRAKEYVRVDAGSSRNPIVKDIWDSVPRHTQQAFKAAFQGQGVMIRSDMLNNSVGYRAASVTDVFTGLTNMDPETRKALENVAYALAGKNAYTILVNAEKTWQGIIGTAKDVIVVRSGVVAVANLLANQVQLMQMTGWNPARLLRVQLAKGKELEHYMRNQSQLTRLNLELASTTAPSEITRITLEQQALRDANRRLSINPMLEAGMLPTIAEGLSEQDQYTLLHDGMRWIEKKAEKLPKGVLTTAKYAIIAKDTALYQGMNRMVQFGDFVAKAAMYEALMEKQKATKGSEQESLILDEVNESFVNYNLLPGRGRDFLEGMGATWFWNYKIRIQKIVLRNFKRNPLAFMGMGVGAEMLGFDSLFSSSAPMINWPYSVGPDQLTRAHDTLLWRSFF